MLKSIQVKNFRLFRDLTVKPLNRVNLIAGENNTGKTALLEALYLLYGDLNKFRKFPSGLRSSQDKDEIDSFWLWLLYQKKLENCLEVRVVDELNHTHFVRCDPSSSSKEQLAFVFGEKGLFEAPRQVNKDGGSGTDKLGINWPTLDVFSTNPTRPSDDADQFNRIAAKRGGRKRLIELLRVIEPRLQDLQYLKLGQIPLVYADLGMEDLIPTTQLGQGFSRLLRLFSEILVSKSTIVLIDEIENGIHYSAMSEVWKGIATIARQEDLQIFATTHSYECIRSAHEAFSSEPTYDLALHRFERVDDEIRVATYNQETL